MFFKLIIVLYFTVLGFLAIIGLHRYYLILLYKKYKSGMKKAPEYPGTLPTVTIQLPVYNEQFVIERLIRESAKIEYPAEKLHIQVLDDSTDETTDICQRVVDELSRKGVNIELIHRTDRTGYKAGALGNGLKTVKSEMVAIFDADFIPSRTFLMETVGFFRDSEVGMVQVRWDYINERFSLLTRLQAMFLDGHFVVEHSARNWSGRFFNFNGTAGIWRVKAIRDAGGWEYDTLTEDLDLSYRAQMNGWKFVYLLDSTCKSEIPVAMNDYKTQQFRWAKGSIETGKKILPRIFASKLPFKVKLESLFHMGNNLAYLALISLSVLTFPALMVRIHMNWRTLAWVDFAVFIMAFVPVTLFYVFAQKEAGKNWKKRSLLLPLLLSLGIGISANNSVGVWEGLVGRKSPFVRTPKYKVEKSGESWWKKKGYGQFELKRILIELFMAVYTLQSVFFAIYFDVYLSVPFLMLFVVGFSYTSIMSIYHAILKGPKGRHGDFIPQLD